MSREQATVYRCPICGETTHVQRLSPWVFVAPCRCRMVFAWRKNEAPPQFGNQLELFAEVV